ncbi:MAG: IPT/TIG domain-containing protein [candidate division NC10 bacterium]|nr:IPT/TIG domain-containing protein [candidate division NC10 bacterium]
MAAARRPSPAPHALLVLATTILLVCGTVPGVGAQAITYEYDALGRLILVSSPEGIARYEYDAVGNILRIVTRRSSETTDPVAILMLVPDLGPVGTEVHLYGKGFGETPAANQVAFHGTPAPVTAASSTRLVTTVPSGATTGLLTVTTPLGIATSPDPFTVTQQLAVVPAQADVVLGGSLGFTATLDGLPAPTVTWAVNGTPGGTATVGTISPQGRYTAPSAFPGATTVTIQASLSAEPAPVAQASVTLVSRPAGLVGAPAVSLGPPGSGVSLGTTAAPVRLGPPGSGTGLGVLAAAVSFTGGPVVSAISPATAPAGTTGLPVTLTGTNLMGATTVRLLRTGAVDPTCTVSGLTAAPDGTQVSFTLTIASGAPPGPRLVQAVTPQGTSASFDLGTNTLTVTPP